MVGRSCTRAAYGTIVSNTISLTPCAVRWLLHPAPVGDAQGHHLDGGDVVVDRHVLVVRVHDGGRAGAEDHGRRLAVEIEEAGIGSALAAADLGVAPGDLPV